MITPFRRFVNIWDGETQYRWQKPGGVTNLHDWMVCVMSPRAVRLKKKSGTNSKRKHNKLPQVVLLKYQITSPLFLFAERKSLFSSSITIRFGADTTKRKERVLLLEVRGAMIGSEFKYYVKWKKTKQTNKRLSALAF